MLFITGVGILKVSCNFVPLDLQRFACLWAISRSLAQPGIKLALPELSVAEFITDVLVESITPSLSFCLEFCFKRKNMHWTYDKKGTDSRIVE